MAYQFNGTSQHLFTDSVPASATPLTMACFFSGSVSSEATLLCLLRRDAGFNILALSVRGTGRLGAAAFDGNLGVSESGATLSANTLYHGAAVFTSTTSRLVYLDGVAGTTNTNSVNPTGLNRTAAAASPRSSVAERYQGQISEFGIWDVSLTQPEIQSLAKGMTCDKIRPQNLKFYAPLVRDLIDVKGGLTITNNNAATVANHPRVYA